MKILLVQPTYDGTVSRDAAAMMAHAQVNTKTPIVAWSGETSFLTLQFNKFWCMALNDSAVTHFVMLHADVIPKDTKWLNKLLTLADGKNADVLSVVCRLKRDDGITSTALGKVGEYGNFRRLTLKEVRRLPETFNAQDVEKLFEWEGANRLLVNTGCMVVRMQKRSVLETMRFTVNNWIKKDKRGKFYPLSEPEDWEWSVQAADNGLSVWATRALGLKHVGRKEYDSFADEGLEQDNEEKN